MYEHLSKLEINIIVYKKLNAERSKIPGNSRGNVSKDTFPGIPENWCVPVLDVHFWFVFIIFTVRLHVMQRTVLLSEFCPSVRLSVCPSVRCVYCDKTKQRTANILISHETAITLVL